MELNKYINKEQSYNIYKWEGYQWDCFSPTVKDVQWNIAFCLRAVPAATVHAYLCKLP